MTQHSLSSFKYLLSEEMAGQCQRDVILSPCPHHRKCETVTFPAMLSSGENKLCHTFSLSLFWQPLSLGWEENHEGIVHFEETPGGFSRAEEEVVVTG